MTLYAHLTAGQIDHTGPLPQTWNDGTRDWDLRPGDPDTLAAAGWHPVTPTDRPADTATTTHEHGYAVVNGEPVETWTERPKTPEQIAREAEQDARLDSHEARIARLEAAQWPPPPAPATPTDPSIKDWTGWAGIVPAGSLVKDSGKIYRNISGVPLTTAPSAMPGGATAWAHLWALANRRHNPPTAPAWSATATYAVGDIVTKDGHRWSCLIAHGTERQGTWAPGIAPTIWSDLGPA